MRVGLASVGVCAALAAHGHALAENDEAAGPSARHTSAHADRVLLSSTAETHPAGTVFASSYELVIVQAGYALHDRLQIEVTGVPFVPNEFAIGEMTLKANLLRSRWLRVAALTSMAWASARADEDPDADADGRRQIVFGRAGGVLQVCFELRCRTSLSLSATAFAHAETDLLWPIAAGAGFTARLNDDLALLIEYTGIFNASRDFGVIPLPAVVLGYAFRIEAHRSWALDLGFARTLESDGARRVGGPDLVNVFGIPVYAFTYRFDT
jgi:hypothetical protein